MPSGGKLRGDPMADEDDEDDEGASSTMAHALALTEDSDFGEMEDAAPEVGGAKLRVGVDSSTMLLKPFTRFASP